MNQSQLVKFDVVRNESEQLIDNSVILLILPVISSYGTAYEIPHGTDEVLNLTENNRRVMTAETERIAHRTLHIALLRLVERQIESGSISGSRFSLLIVGGITPLLIAKMQASASTAPAAPNRCPVMDLVDEILTS